jgi:hypothetical protein
MHSADYTKEEAFIGLKKIPVSEASHTFNSPRKTHL